MKKSTRSQIDKLIDNTENSEDTLKVLKNLAVRTSNYELAVDLRQIERDNFPETDESREARESAEVTSSLLGACDIQASLGTCWLIREVINAYQDTEKPFVFEDINALIGKRDKVFKV